MKRLLFSLLVLTSLISQAQTIITVGPGQQYLTINQAYASIPATISGPYEIRLMTGYSSFSETFPIVLDARSGSSATNTITIVSQFSGATIATAADNTIEFRGCSHVRIDGSVASAGDTANLKIINTNTEQHAVLFTNGANNCTVKFCDIMGVNDNISSSGGMIRFEENGGSCENNLLFKNTIHKSSPSGSGYALVFSDNGNDNNTVQGNYFYNGATGLILLGTNDGWVITENHFYSGGQFVKITEGEIEVTNNYIGGTAAYASGTISTQINVYEHLGIIPSLFEGNIINNYRLLAANNSRSIVSCDSCVVSNNIFGDSTQQGTIECLVHNNATMLELIRAPFVQNNVVSGLRITNQNGSNPTLSLKIISASVVASGNLIGSEQIPSSIWADNGVTCGLAAIYQSDNLLIANGNRIANVLVEDPSTYTFLRATVASNNWLSNISTESGFLIHAEGNGNTCTNNTIDNAVAQQFIYARGDVRNCSISNSISWGTTNPSYQIAAIHFRGNLISNTIFNVGTPYACYSLDMILDSIYGNQIDSIFWAGNVSGIWLDDNFATSSSSIADRLTFESNTISRLYSTTIGDFVRGIDLQYSSSESKPLYCRSNQIEKLFGRFVYGIAVAGPQISSLADTIAFNTIRDLNCGNCFGISTGNTGVPQVVVGNTIESLDGGGFGEQNSWVVYGIRISAGVSQLVANENLLHDFTSVGANNTIVGVSNAKTCLNNILRIGIDGNGMPIATNTRIFGIYFSGTSNPGLNSDIYNNSIFLGGDNGNGSNNSYCIYGTNTGNLQVVNNILQNSRSNSGGTGRHFTYGNANTTVNQTVNYNLHFADGAGGALATFDDGVTSISSLSGMQSAQVGQHLNSWNSDPMLINPDGNLNNWSMAPDMGSNAYGNGVYLPQVTTDFYGYARTFTPTIGAIENSLWVNIDNADETPQTIVYPNPSNGLFQIETDRVQEYRVYDVLGNLVSQNSNTSTKVIDLRGEPAGIYSLQMLTDGGWSTQQLVKQ